MKTRARILSLAIVANRLFLGGIFLTGGMSKLIPFPGIMGPVWLEAELEPHGLGLYARFIAWSEVVIGLLLLSRFATVGAIMLVPMLLNILMVTISLNWRGTPYVVGFFLLQNAFLLICDYHRWKFLFTDTEAPKTLPWRRRQPYADLVSVTALIGVLAGPALYGIAPRFGYGVIAVSLLTMAIAAVWRTRRGILRTDRGAPDAH